MGNDMSSKGLSPRVRGNRPHLRWSLRRPRSIPACAGEPSKEPPPSPPWAVYPRVCGGTTFPSRTALPTEGLSPRVRGNLNRGPAGPSAPGSIPACAGEPSPDPRSSGCSRVYPRVCGGTSLTTPVRVRQRGLSPRVRGNLKLFHRRTLAGRSIPACAGEPAFTVSAV